MSNIHTFIAEKKQLYPMIDWIMERIRKFHFSTEVEQQINVAIEEALANIIHYAYPKSSGEITISCESAKEKKGIIIVFKDKGIPFNPIAFAENTREKILSLNVETMSVGGWGIHLIIGIMDEVDYRRENEFNILSMTKYV